MLSFLKNIIGIVCISLAVYFSISIMSMPVLGGVFHVPSLFLVVGVTLGLAILIMEVRDLQRFLSFVFVYSSNRQLQQMQQAEKSFENLVTVYSKEGGEGFHRAVVDGRMPRIWSIVATKLAINVPIDDIKDILDFQIQRVVSRLDQDITTLRQLAAIAPAVGMFGTLLGLIRLLKNMTDFETLGTNMSLALITTLYGVFIGNILLVPLIRAVEKRKLYNIKNHTNLLYFLDHVDKKKPAFYMKTRLRDLDVKTV